MSAKSHLKLKGNVFSDKMRHSSELRGHFIKHKPLISEEWSSLSKCFGVWSRCNYLEIISEKSRKCTFFLVYFRETSAPLAAKIIDTTNADLELKVEVNQTSMALIPRREQLEANSPVTKPCIGEKEWV